MQGILTRLFKFLNWFVALKISGQPVLLVDHPGIRHSIGLRKKVVLPVLIIQ